MPKALIVDDQADLADTLKRQLAKFGFERVTALSGVRALAEIKNPDIGVLLLDATTPEISGPDALARIEEIREGAPMPEPILVTASIDEAAARYGAPVIRKPIVDFAMPAAVADGALKRFRRTARKHRGSADAADSQTRLVNRITDERTAQKTVDKLFESVTEIRKAQKE